MSGALFIRLAAFGGGGLALGLAHFATLRANVRLYTTAGPLWRPIALNLIRLAATAGTFVAAAALGGALPALAALTGFVLARTAILRTARSGP